MRRLADQCGLANGALRRYFRFKDDVMLALEADVERRLAEYAELAGYPSQRGLDALQTLVDSMLPLDPERRATVEVLAALRDHAVSDRVFAEAVVVRTQHLFDQIVHHLEQALEDQQIQGSRRLEVTAAILVNTVVGISMTASFADQSALSKYDSAAVKAILESA